MHTKPEPQHAFLQQLVGEWTYDGEALMGPDSPPEKMSGTETVRSLGGLWVIGEGKGKMPDGGEATMIVTLGYDPALGKYVGTWIGSMMARLWVYEVTVEGNVINMESDGPSFADPNKTVRYRDAIEIVSSDHRIFTASFLPDDGSRITFMTIHYRRKK
ncbi:DUF1579 domain-containing protein [Humisphaera borealis]|uniref:DUF1579 domain-containing protein n=1 Tax=Humisphaera borealis TaxID=2807512 RepID=A0A7M2WUC2_9BACT|nr:DUF1579 domain-containing protein [Humisphaera borealis]QOV89125.1 DUF1579 domain-containing protein [Humisphaera borealis]